MALLHTPSPKTKGTAAQIATGKPTLKRFDLGYNPRSFPKVRTQKSRRERERERALPGSNPSRAQGRFLPRTAELQTQPDTADGTTARPQQLPATSPCPAPGYSWQGATGSQPCWSSSPCRHSLGIRPALGAAPAPGVGTEPSPWCQGVPAPRAPRAEPGSSPDPLQLNIPPAP